MKDAKFNIGDSVYVVRNWNVMRFKVTAVITARTANAVNIEYKITDPFEKEQVISESELLKTFEEAKELAIQNLDATVKSLRTQVVGATEDMFDKMEKDHKKEQKAKKKKGKKK